MPYGPFLNNILYVILLDYIYVCIKVLKCIALVLQLVKLELTEMYLAYIYIIYMTLHTTGLLLDFLLGTNNALLIYVCDDVY